MSLHDDGVMANFGRLIFAVMKEENVEGVRLIKHESTTLGGPTFVMVAVEAKEGISKAELERLNAKGQELVKSLNGMPLASPKKMDA